MATTINNMILVRCAHTATTGVTESYTMTRTATAIDLVVIQTNANDRDVTLSNSTVAISGGLSPTGDTNVRRPNSADPWIAASKDLAVGDTLDFTVGTDDMSYQAFAYLYPTPGAVT
jgi:hypothetical protein